MLKKQKEEYVRNWLNNPLRKKELLNAQNTVCKAAVELHRYCMLLFKVNQRLITLGVIESKIKERFQILGNKLTCQE